MNAGHGAQTLSALYPLCPARCLAHEQGEQVGTLEEAATSSEHGWGQGRGAGGSHTSLGWIKEESRGCNEAKFSSGVGGSKMGYSSGDEKSDASISQSPATSIEEKERHHEQ